MKYGFLLLSMLCMAQLLTAQKIYTIKADSVKITNDCDTAELIIENHTQHVPGFLFNKGRGRTEFRRAATRLNDTTLVIGGDTIVLTGLIAASNGLSMVGNNVVLGQDEDDPANPAALTSIRQIPLNGNAVFFTGAGVEPNLKTGVYISDGTLDIVGDGIGTPRLSFGDQTNNTIGIIHRSSNSFSINSNNQKILYLYDSLGMYLGSRTDGIPSHMLHVEGNGYFEDRRTGLTTHSYAFKVHDSSKQVNTAAEPLSAYAGQFVANALRENGTNPLTNIGLYATAENGQKNYAAIFDKGNVGIGTHAPDAKLHVSLIPASGSVGVFHVEGVDAFAQAFVLQAPSSGYTGNMFQTFKGFGGLGGAMGLGVNFDNNNPQYFSIINNNAQSLVKVYNENSFTGPTLRFIVGRNAVNTGQMLQVKGTASITGNAIFGDTVNVPSAKVEIAAGTASAGTAPLKLTAGTVLTTPEDGAIEYDGTDLYLTQFATRYKLSKTLTGQLTTSFGAPSLAAFTAVSTTLTVNGAQPGDVVIVNANAGSANPASIIITAFITTTNTVTVQAYNASNSPVTLASDTYKVRIVR